MSASTSGQGIQFTPLQSSHAPGQAVLKVVQAQPQLTRTYYQDGRLLTAADLNRDFAYLDRRMRDLGTVLGDGIVQGLDARLVNGAIQITAGRGIAPSGRVVAYAGPAPLSASLADVGAQQTLNGPTFTGIADGLYAVVLLHGQRPEGLAETFPRDLTTRQVSFDHIVDTVEIVLIGLPQPIPAGTAFQARAQLAAQLTSAQGQPSLPWDGVPLGVLAEQRGGPAWFDPALLRHPLRPADDRDGVVDDLGHHYLRLYADLKADLAGRGVASFRAQDVFTLLPPQGMLPKAAIDPTPSAQSQTFFPEAIEVAMMPARIDEVDALLRQTTGEPPIDLTSGAASQVLVLVPLAPPDFAALVPALLGPATTPPPFKPYPSVVLSRIDPLILRLPGRRLPLPTQPSIWARIWDQAPLDLPWMVRPADGGLTGLKAAVLAAGFTPPPLTPPPPTPTPSPARPPLTAPPITPPPITRPPQ